jgi:hypothetical protein
LTQRDFAEAGEQITIRFFDCASAALTVRPRSVALASSSRSRKIGSSRVGTMPAGVVWPTRRFGTRQVSSALCSPLRPGFVLVAVADEGEVARDSAGVLMTQSRAPESLRTRTDTRFA